MTSEIQPPKSMICIPGPWADHKQLQMDIVRANDGKFVPAVGFLMDAEAGIHFDYELDGYNPMMRQAFQYAGQKNGLEEDFLDIIKGHKSTVYLVGTTGSQQAAADLARSASAILRAGGFGVKVESAGVAFTAEHWLELQESGLPGDLHEMFVVDWITDENMLYSCGMHHLGLKDTIVAFSDFEESAQLVWTFNHFQVIENPTIESGQTFGVAQGSPVYRIVDEPDQPMAGDDLFENPYGMWRLLRQ